MAHEMSVNMILLVSYFSNITSFVITESMKIEESENLNWNVFFRRLELKNHVYEIQKKRGFIVASVHFLRSIFKGILYNQQPARI